MPDVNDFKARRPKYTVLLNGLFGAGKTLQAHSFPKCYTLSVDPDGLEVLRQPRNASFLNNLVWFEELNVDGNSPEELKALFNAKATAKDLKSIYGCLAHCAELAKKGEVETLILDGGTYLTSLLWAKICHFEEARSEKSGNVDRMAMYRSLGIQLQSLFASSILTMASRANVNVVCTFHLQRVSPEEMDGTSKGAQTRARKLTLDSDLAIQIEGGFRNKIEGLFGGSLYLERKLGRDREGKAAIDYRALCDLTTGFDTVINAKTRWGLPPRLSLNDKTLYQALTEALAVKPAPAGKGK